MNKAIYFFILLALWLLLTWSVDVQNVAVGAVVALACTVFVGHLFFENTAKMFDPRRIFWFLYYIPVFFIHMVWANIDVAYRVLHVDVPIRPGIVKVKTTLKSDLGLTFLANSITLTPGTLTVDIIGSDMYIHWIYVHSDDPERQTEMIVSRFENILKKVFE
ncbi:MAG: Na+/H+ antiporter subunit E [Candidatus Latescibacteria bacterium]|nr:Na+/H+ antiporter subunit E [Candidatus Latescibacterota bacterium]